MNGLLTSDIEILDSTKLEKDRIDEVQVLIQIKSSYKEKWEL